MSRATVAILKTQPSTVIHDYHELLNLAGYQDIVDRAVDTALKVNISWHFFFPGRSTTPWQLDGVIRAMKRDGYDPSLLHACHNRTVVIDAHLGEREKQTTRRRGVARACATCIFMRARTGSTSEMPSGI